MSLLHSIVAICYLLSVTYNLLLANCYLLSDIFYQKLTPAETFLLIIVVCLVILLFTGLSPPPEALPLYPAREWSADSNPRTGVRGVPSPLVRGLPGAGPQVHLWPVS